MPEGHHYVLDENGFVILLDNGTPEIEADQPEAPKGETPEQYEQRTGYKLPEGHHYVLDENGFVILLENGSPQIAADDISAPSTNEELVANQQDLRGSKAGRGFPVSGQWQENTHLPRIIWKSKRK